MGWSEDPGDYTPDTVALCGDWHGNDSWARQMLDRAADHHVRIVLHMGDLGFWHADDNRHYLGRLSDTLARYGQVLFWVDGNHENHDLLNSLPLNRCGTRTVADRIVHLPRGFRWTWPSHDGTGGVSRTWLAVGGAASIDLHHRREHVSWWASEILDDRQTDTIAAAGPADIMVCHDAPTGVEHLDRWLATYGFRLPDDVHTYTAGNRERLSRIVDQVRPAHLWHGHYHHRYDDTLTLDSGHPVQVHGLGTDGDNHNMVICDL